MDDLRLTAWNVQDNLNDKYRSISIVDRALRAAATLPDVLLFSEAVASGTAVYDVARVMLESSFERVRQVPYEDDDGRPDKHDYVIAWNPHRFDSDPQIIRPMGRPVFNFTTKEGVSVVGLHGFDRFHGKPSGYGERRTAQLSAVISSLGHNAVVFGDLNDMHRGGDVAMLLRAFGPVARKLPWQDPGLPQSKLERLGSMSRRLVSMAGGMALEYLEGNSFRDADPRHRPTKRLGPIGVQLDHVMLRGDLVAERTKVVSARGLSDHELITTVVQSRY